MKLKSLLVFCCAFFSLLRCDVALLLDWPCPNFSSEQVPDGDDPSNKTSWMAWLNKELEKHGHRLILIDLSAPGMQKLFDPSIVAVLFNNCTPIWGGRDMVSVLQALKAKKILITWEPPTVLPTLHDRNFWKNFDAVLTWDASRLESQQIIQFSYPNLVPMQETMPSFSERRLLTQVSMNKMFLGPNELYSLRQKVNGYFDAHPECDFTFYGYGWDQSTHRAYGGPVEDKIGVLQKFRFSICFENTKDASGYVTEKILDCFGAGCVPVYYGAKDISSYIPEGCYIRWERFGSIEPLYDYLKNMSEEEFLGYQGNIRKFLASKEAKLFTNRALAQKLLAVIAPKNAARKT